MRSMSFMLTTAQIRDRTKTVTRRLGWAKLQPGTRLKAVVKAMGLKKGEKQEVLCEIEVVSVKQEKLGNITTDDISKEGFPGMSRIDFVLMFCKHMKCTVLCPVNRIEFKYVEET